MGSAAAQVVVTNPNGLHLRPATEFARAAVATGCAIRVRAGDQEANGASVLELAMLGVAVGTTLTISAEGPDCDAALAGLVALVRNDFRA